jgi:hypothetical protein
LTTQLIILIHHMYKCLYLDWNLICDLLHKSWFDQLWLEEWNPLPNIYFMMGLWRGVCLLCQNCMMFCLVLKTCLKFSLYSVPNEKFNMIILKLRDVCRTQSCDLPRGLEVIWGMSNTMILKLRSVCRIQSCDPLHGLEMTWGLKMSKLLNLIA